MEELYNDRVYSWGSKGAETMETTCYKTMLHGHQEAPILLSYLEKRTNRRFSLPLNVSEPGGVPESFGKRIAVYFQLGYLGRKKWVQTNLISKVKETESEIGKYSCKYQEKFGFG